MRGVKTSASETAVDIAQEAAAHAKRTEEIVIVIEIHIGVETTGTVTAGGVEASTVEMSGEKIAETTCGDEVD